MLSATMIALWAAWGAAVSPDAVLVPEDVPTFTLVLTNDPTEYAVGLLVDNRWYLEKSDLAPDIRQIEVVFDRPWNPQPPQKIMRSKIARLTPEVPALRRTRLSRGWEAAGYTFVDTPRGRQAVLKRDIELAHKAQEMAEAVNARLYPAEAPAAPESAETPAEPGSGPGWIQQWWPHLLTLAGGIAALALVIRWILRSGKADSGNGPQLLTPR